MNRIKELRMQKGLLQKDLAVILKVAQNTLSYWEQGKFQPDTDTLKKLADYFNVSVDYLLGRTDNPDTLDAQLEGVDFALYGEVKDLTDEEKEKILEFVKFTKSQRKKT